MLGNCLALMVKWSIEAAGPIYHADTMHGRQGRPQQPAHNDTTHIQLHTRCKDIAGNFLVCLYRDNFRKLDVLFVAHILCWWWSAESMVVGKFCGKVVNLSDKKPCTEKRAEERGADESVHVIKYQLKQTKTSQELRMLSRSLSVYYCLLVSTSVN